MDADPQRRSRLDHFKTRYRKQVVTRDFFASVKPAYEVGRL
jgi:hypothetical protein